MQTEETEGQKDWTMEEGHELLIDRANRILPPGRALAGVKALAAPDPIDRYDMEQSELAGGFASFLIEQTVNGITNSARWAFRQLRR